MFAARVLDLIAAAVGLLWCAYNVLTLATEGVYFKPGGRYGVGAWTAAAEQPALCAFTMALYALIPAFFLFLARRKSPRGS